MKTVSRNLFAAALGLGAAVFAWPVQALDCPMPPYYRKEITEEQLIAIAKKQVSDAPAIFRGRLVTVKYLGGAQKDLPLFLMTYRVSKWKKGRGTRFATIFKTEWCDGNCKPNALIADYLTDSEEKLFVANPTISYRPDGKYLKDLLKRVDGADLLCGPHPIIRTPNQKERQLSRMEYIFRTTLAEELEKLPSKEPSQKP